METAFPSTVQTAPERSVARSEGWRLGIPTYIYAVVFSSFCVIMGLLWDIMWHMSIGRDGLLAPPHVVIYVGAIVSGLFSAYQILNLTITKNHPGRAEAVPFWGVFYGPLGAMFSVWGALAMLTSAPFDDWWHNTYGLDVQILTPPHTILGIGIMTLQFGAMVGVLALQNQYRTMSTLQTDLEARRATRLQWLFAITAALLLTMLYTIASESMGKFESHNSVYYATGAIVMPFFLLAVGRASLLRWPITTIAGLYMLAFVLPSWVLQYFPATPRLGPVLNPITHYQPFSFPVLLVFPALALDWLMHRFETARPDGSRRPNDWLLAGLYGVVFVAVLLLVQWPFGEFLQTSPYAQNGFFLSYSWTYNSQPDWIYRYQYPPWLIQTPADFWAGIGRAVLYAILSARIGLAWGKWMKRVVR